MRLTDTLNNAVQATLGHGRQHINVEYQCYCSVKIKVLEAHRVEKASQLSRCNSALDF